jgi:hypothetical protein
MSKATTRRKFLAAAGAAGAAALVPGTSQAAQPEEAPSPARLLTDVVRRRFGKHLTDAQLKNIEESIAANIAGADAMKRVRLENSDEPATVFVPDVE